MGSCLSKSVKIDVASPQTKETLSADSPKEMEVEENYSKVDELETTEKENQDDLTDMNETDKDGKDSDSSGKQDSKKVLTPQQIEELAESSLEAIRNRIEKVYSVENYDQVTDEGHFPVTTRNFTILVVNSYFALKGAPLGRALLFRKTIANILLETKAIELICEIYKYYVKAGWTSEQDGVQKPDKTKWTPFQHSGLVLLNYSDASDEFAIYIADYPGLLDAIRYVMVEQKEAHLKGEEEVCLTHSHTMTPFDAPGKQAF